MSDVVKDSGNSGANPHPNGHSGLLTWPVLGIAVALLLTVAWCGFLTWLLFQI